VDVVDVGLSDHRLLRWQVPMSRPPPVYNAVVRPWRLLNSDLFRQQLMSRLCNSESWSHCDVGSLARLYDTELEAVLDRLIPKRSVTCLRRSSEPRISGRKGKLHKLKGYKNYTNKQSLDQRPRIRLSTVCVSQGQVCPLDPRLLDSRRPRQCSVTLKTPYGNL